MAAGDDVPMRDAPPLPPPPQAASAPESAPQAKPKRRFAPQLVEETIRSSGKNKNHAQVANSANMSQPLAPTPPMSTANSTRRPTRDASVQVDDIEMPDAPRPPPSKPIRRFAPVPIETTFDSYRVNKNPHGPTAEPTPDPSPTTPHLPLIIESGSNSRSAQSSSSEQNPAKGKKPRRKFAPQLIETTRRARKAGQEGPATKPVDKTDITPGTNHIYAPKPKRRPGPPRASSTGNLNGLADSDEENLSRFLTPRRQTSMKPHPNTRRVTRTNSYHPELDTIASSESGESEHDEEKGRPCTAISVTIRVPPRPDGAAEVADKGDAWNSRHYELRDRRESCDEEFSGYLLAVAAREAHRQRELEQAMSAFPNGVRTEGVEHFLVRDNSEDDALVGEDEPLRHGPSQLLRRKSTEASWAVKEMRAHAEKLARERAERMNVDEDQSHLDKAFPANYPLWTPSSRRQSRDTEMVDAKSPYLSPQSPGTPVQAAPVQEKPFALPAQGGGLRASPFGMPFAALRVAEPEDRELRRMRMAASPPMLGGDLKFRMCPSPQHTRMEPSQPYSQFDRPEEKQRDVSESTGLWRGYCSAKANDSITPGLQAPLLLQTPSEPLSPNDPFSSAFSASLGSMATAQSPTPGSPNKRHSGPKGGLHMLTGLDERLQKEKARKELEERILAEFDDAFVTQVYNYISLGYPATARAFDDELSKISGIDIEELRKDDNQKVEKGFMLQMEMKVRSNSSGSSSPGSSGDDLCTPEEDERRARHKPPRWKALKLYIREWARQHPSLGNDGSSPMAWGVRARRGSWAI
ncbi:hypothetical protein F5X96DRAFT_285058 [Biscogniauxia mediterranea]|nr:hypothetical protein F5X96DRAFT_285058 [Biscogniauxia mediterranea]